MVAALAVAQQYRDNQITSSAPEQTVLMLYDGAIRFLRSAVNELKKGNVPEKAKLIEKAANIVDYLQSCLDKEKGGEIAANLDRLYDYILVELTEANIKNDPNRIDSVINVLQPIRDAWYEICNPKAQKTPANYNASEPVKPLKSITVKA